MLVDAALEREEEVLVAPLDAVLESDDAPPVAPLRPVNELSVELYGVPTKAPAIEVSDRGDPLPYVDTIEEGGGPFCDGEAAPVVELDPRGELDPEDGSPEIIGDDDLGAFAAPAVADAPNDSLPTSEPGWLPSDAADGPGSVAGREPGAPGALALPADAIRSPEIEPEPRPL
jgi:hypothetical protein